MFSSIVDWIGLPNHVIVLIVIDWIGIPDNTGQQRLFMRYIQQFYSNTCMLIPNLKSNLLHRQSI